MVEADQAPLEDRVSDTGKIILKFLHTQHHGHYCNIAHLRLCSLQMSSRADIISLKRPHSARVNPYSIRCRRKVLRLDCKRV